MQEKKYLQIILISKKFLLFKAYKYISPILQRNQSFIEFFASTKKRVDGNFFSI